MLYDGAGEALRDGNATVHSLETFSQLASIEGSTLRAPDGQRDDRATAFVLALAGRVALAKRVDLHALLDQIIAGGRQAGGGIGDGMPSSSSLPSTPAGGVAYFPAFDEYHVYRVEDGRRRYVFGTQEREAALVQWEDMKGEMLDAVCRPENR